MTRKKAMNRCLKFDEQIEEINKQLKSIVEQKHSFYIKHKLYNPISKLKSYRGKKLRCIHIYYRESDSDEIKEDYLFNIDILEVTEKGNLYYSTYDNEIVSWSKDTNKYMMHRNHLDKCIDIIGFDDLEYNDD